MGGSTNAAIHLIAIARRAGIDLNWLEQLAETAAQNPRAG